MIAEAYLTGRGSIIMRARTEVEKVQGELYNVEFATFDAVKDPLKMKK